MSKEIKVLINGEYKLKTKLNNIDIDMLDSRMINLGFGIEDNVFKKNTSIRMYNREDIDILVNKFTKHSSGSSSNDGMRSRYNRSLYEKLDSWMQLSNKKMIIISLYNAGDKILMESVDADVIYKKPKPKVDNYFIFRKALTFIELYNTEEITETKINGTEHKSWVIPSNNLEKFIAGKYKVTDKFIDEEENTKELHSTDINDVIKKYEQTLDEEYINQTVEKNKHKITGDLGEFMFYNLMDNELFLKKILKFKEECVVNWLSLSHSKANHDFEVVNETIKYSFEIKTTLIGSKSFEISSNEKMYADENEANWRLVKINLSKHKDIFKNKDINIVIELIKNINDFDFIEVFTKKQMEESFDVGYSSSLMVRKGI